MQGQLWIEPIGDLIIARLRGEPSELLLRACQDRVLQIARDTAVNGIQKVLYDALEMESPPVDVPLSQRRLDDEMTGGLHLRRAIVVPNTRLAFLARLAFGEGDYRVFYNDMTGALLWLSDGSN
jgi:hypothetical protein